MLRHFTSTARRVARPLGPWLVGERASIARVRLTLAGLSREPGPIAVGPWLSEVGFELLYWIPFLQWVKSLPAFADRRFVPVSRGGAKSWYQNITSDYAEIFNSYSLEDFRAANDRRVVDDGGWKHWTLSEWDEEIIRRTTGLGAVLHPSAMYKLFRPVWLGRAGIEHVLKFTRYQPFQPPPRSEALAHLPEDYVAVKFYFNTSFPETEANRAFVARLLGRLAQRTNVVVLTTGFSVDEHRQYQELPRDRIWSLESQTTPANNLEIQSEALSRASAFFGTYGGFSYLAPLYGVNTLALYSDPTEFVPHHLELAQRVFTSLGSASFTALKVSDLALIEQVTEGLA